MRLYDGAQFCHTDACCPVADYSPANKTVRLYDPAKPEKGEFLFTDEEYRNFLNNAKNI